MNFLAPVRFVGDWLLGIARGVSEQPGESEQIHLRKTTAVISAIVVAPAAIIWGVIYFVAGEDLAGIVPSLYAPLTALNIVVYKFSGRYRAFEFFQLTLNLILPLLLMLALGGFVSSSAVVPEGLDMDDMV